MADKYIKKLADVLCGLIFDKREREPEPYDTMAEVRRVENGKAYVHIPGGVDETPVDLTIDAAAGDTVQVRVSGGRAWLAGNRTAPPTDDTTARVAQDTAAKAEVRAEQAEETANAVNGIANSALAQAAAAKQIADDTEQHFWFKETGTDTGAHITEVTQDEWEDVSDPNYHAGGNLLARTNGMAVRDGMTELASFSATGATIGQNVNGKTRAEISTAGLSIVQKIGNVDIGIAVLGYGAGVDENGDPVDVPYYDIGQRAAATVKGGYSVVESQGNTATAYCAHAEGYSTHALNVGAHAEGFRTEATGEFSHVEGTDTYAAGDYSHAEGQENWAGGEDSHAEGWYTRASGVASHAEGSETTAKGASSHAGGIGTKAGYTGQYAIGQYNDNKSTNIFEVGNGTAGAKSNAFEVSNTGGITAGGHPSGLLAEEVLLADNKTISGNNYGNDSLSVAKSGYTPIGIVGMHLQNATSGGTLNTYCMLHSFYLSGSTAYWIVRNTNSSAAKIKVTATILYVKS